MPTTYTHDAFGRETYQQLPEEIKDRIRPYKKLYLIGLHGPDIFFYYKPYIFKGNELVDFGHAMHKEKARIFFEEGIKTCRGTNSGALMAYLMGFVCHYILDSTCHPFVDEYEHASGLSHTETETELDRFFMERDGKNPFAYHPACAIVADDASADVISMAFPVFSEKQIRKALEGMKLYCNITVTDQERKRKMFHRILKLVGADDYMGKRIIEKEKNPKSAASTRELVRLYERALDEIVPAVTNFYRAVMEGETLSERFDQDYCNYS